MNSSALSTVTVPRGAAHTLRNIAAMGPGRRQTPQLLGQYHALRAYLAGDRSNPELARLEPLELALHTIDTASVLGRAGFNEQAQSLMDMGDALRQIAFGSPVAGKGHLTGLMALVGTPHGDKVIAGTIGNIR